MEEEGDNGERRWRGEGICEKRGIKEGERREVRERNAKKERKGKET